MEPVKYCDENLDFINWGDLTIYVAIKMLRRTMF
jgi:hypothetical protein